MPVPCRCQVVQFSATPTGPAPYITTKLVGLVKFDATNWLIRGSIGVYAGPNGQTVFAQIPKLLWELGSKSGSANLPIGGFHNAIQENGVPGRKTRVSFRRRTLGVLRLQTEHQFPLRISTNPMRPERFPLHQTRFGLFGSTSILLGSDSESGSGNSTHSPVLGL